METLLNIIAWTLVTLLMLMLNTYLTKELTEIFEGTRLDKPIFYRVCLIPPIGFIIFWVSTLLIVLTFFVGMIKDIWISNKL